jgi:hypothetical protein
MTTFTLIAFILYSNGCSPSVEGGCFGSVAVDNMRVEFFTAGECGDAKKILENAFREQQLKRSFAVCVKRGAALMEGSK